MTTDSTLDARPDLDRLDPAVRAVAAGIDVLEFDAATLPTERDRLNTVSAERAGGVDVTGIDSESHQISDARGANLGIRIYRSAAASAVPIVVFAHGGGFVTGNLDTDHSLCVELARSLDCVVVSVDYRLAPEHPCPAALDDVHSAFDYAIGHAGQLDADRDRIAVVGRDAGAALVAGLAQRVFDAEGPPIRLQLLHEPMLDSDPTRSRRQFARAPGLSGRAMDRGWEHYRRGSATSHHIAPAHRRNLEGLPPAFISCAAIDPSRDEAISYANRLLHAYVHTELHVFAAGLPGLDSVHPHWAVSREVRAIQVRSLRRSFSY
ncbi:MAG: acetyl esterase [Mycobacterium sp.]|nr:acetyl esterase [Mycobacterium sp.]